MNEKYQLISRKHVRSGVLHQNPLDFKQICLRCMVTTHKPASRYVAIIRYISDVN